MTLLIACLLIYNFHMEWWWYGVAGITWGSHLFVNPVLLSLLDN